MKKTFIGLCAFLLTVYNNIWSQTPGNNENFYASNGKFYVVIAVIGIIFVGMIIYLLVLDQRLGKLEKEMTKK